MRALEMALELCALARSIVLGTPTGCRERASESSDPGMVSSIQDSQCWVHHLEESLTCL